MKTEPKNKGSEHLGVTDFLKFMYAGQPEWSLLAIKASAEEVTEELTDFHGAKNVFKSVEIKPGAEYDDIERSEEHTSELQSPCNLVCRLLLEKKKKETLTRSNTIDHIS